MKITYKNRAAQQQFDPNNKNHWRYPKEVIKKLLSMESFLRNAESLHDVAQYTPYRFHKLKAERKNEWSLRVGNTGYRVTLIPCDDDGNEILDGDIMAQFKTIKIVSVTEVSNHYE